MFFYPFLGGVKISGDVIREGTLIIVKEKRKKKKQFQHNTAKESLSWKFRCKMETWGAATSWPSSCTGQSHQIMKAYRR